MMDKKQWIPSKKLLPNLCFNGLPRFADYTLAYLQGKPALFLKLSPFPSSTPSGYKLPYLGIIDSNGNLTIPPLNNHRTAALFSDLNHVYSLYFKDSGSYGIDYNNTNGDNQWHNIDAPTVPAAIRIYYHNIGVGDGKFCAAINPPSGSQKIYCFDTNTRSPSWKLINTPTALIDEKNYLTSRADFLFSRNKLWYLSYATPAYSTQTNNSENNLTSNSPYYAGEITINNLKGDDLGAPIPTEINSQQSQSNLFNVGNTDLVNFTLRLDDKANKYYSQINYYNLASHFWQSMPTSQIGTGLILPSIQGNDMFNAYLSVLGEIMPTFGSRYINTGIGEHLWLFQMSN